MGIVSSSFGPESFHALLRQNEYCVVLSSRPFCNVELNSYVLNICVNFFKINVVIVNSFQGVQVFLDSLVTGECIDSSSANHEKQNR